MILEEHPFNDKIGLPSITDKTTKVILGTFPAFQVTSKDKPKLEFYYGSTDNEFWNLFWEVLSPELELNVDNILKYLGDKQTGIVDIIRKCYRKNNKSSSDEDLSIIEMEDMVKLLASTKIDTIYSTSEFVTKLLKQQIGPLLDRNHPKDKGKKLKKTEVFIPCKAADFIFEKVSLPARTFKIERDLAIKTLLSPSDQGLRGIGKLIKSKNLKTTASEYRITQYKTILK